VGFFCVNKQEVSVISDLMPLLLSMSTFPEMVCIHRLKSQVTFLSAVVSLFFAVFSSSLFSNSLYIAYTNDRHGVIEPHILQSGEQIGGMAWEATMIHELQKKALLEGASFLLVDGGDLFQGTPVVNETLGKCMIELYNDLGYHLVTIGNHEFDYGPHVLVERMKESKFLWVSTNVSSPLLDSSVLRWVTST
jgi:2',3'-cyclic-nucleotide 2'-phosphodiesterase (5'-nucleotidase family)